MKKLIAILSLFLFLSACQKAESSELDLPENRESPATSAVAETNWMRLYSGFLNYEKNLSDYSAFYLGDVNGDQIPELVLFSEQFPGDAFLPQNESSTNSGLVLCVVNNDLQILDLRTISTWGYSGYVEETNQIVFLKWYGHTGGTFGSVEYYLFDWTLRGYVETRSLVRESGYASYGNEDVVEEYGQGYIDGEAVAFEEFEAALAEMEELRDESTWFPMTDLDVVDDWADFFAQWELEKGALS